VSVYDRIAPVYDWIEAPMERMGGAARRARVVGGARGHVLELGVGTGRNFTLYSDAVRVTGIDISARMLERAGEQAVKSLAPITLSQADAQALPFPDASFDSVVATCVFCSVVDPAAGLAEVRRVVKPNGEVRLLEHVRPESPLLGKLFDVLSPLTRRLIGPEINRRTEENVRNAGLKILAVRREGIWREIVARSDEFPGLSVTGTQAR